MGQLEACCEFARLDPDPEGKQESEVTPVLEDESEVPVTPEGPEMRDGDGEESVDESPLGICHKLGWGGGTVRYRMGSLIWPQK